MRFWLKKKKKLKKHPLLPLLLATKTLKWLASRNVTVTFLAAWHNITKILRWRTILFSFEQKNPFFYFIHIFCQERFLSWVPKRCDHGEEVPAFPPMTVLFQPCIADCEIMFIRLGDFCSPQTFLWSTLTSLAERARPLERQAVNASRMMRVLSLSTGALAEPLLHNMLSSRESQTEEIHLGEHHPH